MSSFSSIRLLRDSEAIVISSLSTVDISEIPFSEQRLINRIKNQFFDAKLHLRDYEMSDTKDIQLGHSKNLHKILTLIDKNILKLSEFGILGAVDIAQISAQLNQIIEDTL